MMKTANRTFQMTWFCPDCGTKVNGSEREKGIYVGECSNCHAMMARTKIARHHKAVEVLSPQHEPVIDGKLVLGKIKLVCDRMWMR